MFEIDEMDRPVWGAMRIGRIAGLTDADGNVDKAQVYYAVKMGHIDVTHVGRQLVTTQRRILQSLGIQTGKTAV
jgi:hypothetical protein